MTILESLKFAAYLFIYKLSIVALHERPVSTQIES